MTTLRPTFNVIDYDTASMYPGGVFVGHVDESWSPGQSLDNIFSSIQLNPCGELALQAFHDCVLGTP